MTAAKQPPNIYQRMHGVFSESKFIKKESKKVNNQYKYISFAKVYEDLRPLFIKYGIVNTVTVKNYVQEGNCGTLWAEISFINIDNPEDRHVDLCVGQGLGNDDKVIGKALSYLHKNALLKTFLLGGDAAEDVEYDANSSYKPKSKPKAPVQQGRPSAGSEQPPMAQPYTYPGQQPMAPQQQPIPQPQPQPGVQYPG